MKNSKFHDHLTIAYEVTLAVSLTPVFFLHMMLSPILSIFAILIPAVGKFYLKDRRSFLGDYLLSNPVICSVLEALIDKKIMPAETKIAYLLKYPTVNRLEMIGSEVCTHLTTEDVKHIIEKNSLFLQNEDFVLRALKSPELFHHKLYISDNAISVFIRVAEKHNLWGNLETILGHISFSCYGWASEDMCKLIQHLDAEKSRRSIEKILYQYDAEVLKLVPFLNVQEIFFNILKISPCNKKIEHLLSAYDEVEELAPFVKFLIEKHGISPKLLASLSEELQNKIEELIQS